MSNCQKRRDLRSRAAGKNSSEALLDQSVQPNPELPQGRRFEKKLQSNQEWMRQFLHGGRAA